MVTSGEQQDDEISRQVHQRGLFIITSIRLTSLHHRQQSFEQIRLRQHQLQIIYNDNNKHSAYFTHYHTHSLHGPRCNFGSSIPNVTLICPMSL